MIYESKHPLIKVKLSVLRDKNTPDKVFREVLDEITSFLTYEALIDIKTVKNGTIETPTGATVDCYKINRDLVVLPILRAGIGMTGAIVRMLPTIKVGHIGLYRDAKTLTPIRYYYKMPHVKDAKILIVDPMIATGNSMIDAINLVKQDGFKDITVIALIGAPVGLENVTKHHPDVNIHLAAIDDGLNEYGYIVPGLGDAGDRIFGTK
jgi:uracil phosphoribosyltransferase